MYSSGRTSPELTSSLKYSGSYWAFCSYQPFSVRKFLTGIPGTGESHTRANGKGSPVDTNLVVRVVHSDVVGVQVEDVEVSPSHDEVIGGNDTGNGRQEHRIGGEVGGEVVRRGEEVPRTHSKGNGSTDKPTTANVHAEEAKIPINEVKAKQNGIENACDNWASLGFLANLEKSGAFKIKVEKLARDDIVDLIKAQA
ncbi:hypothetical protein WICPIJ_001079 [Wickerhamomyces pijperi]|uniref:Uncharacterized protein n=1 Tax=Wickerhamomyces pijperi TaxID=599730 RepID=A0A9P8QBK1_WICPI|nr:hypothetical protein WICPIJ_001079 [Wickerhamomyces pijperi]